ncbi:type II toxin-antitoxin system HicA family toxin [Chloroflexota bacterium]
MKLPRDIGGMELARLLEKRGYSITRQTGSHIRLTSGIQGTEHHVTIPHHKPLKTGTLSSVVNSIALYLKVNRDELIQDIFKKK